MDRMEKTTLQKRAEERGITVKVNGRHLKDKNGKIRVFHDLDEACKEGRKAAFIQDTAQIMLAFGMAMTLLATAFIEKIPYIALAEVVIGAGLALGGLLALRKYR